MTKEPYCSRCKTTEKLIKNSKFSYICRECNRKRAEKYRSTEEGRANINKAVSKSIKKHRARQTARARVCYHVKKGNLIKPVVCSICGNEERIYAHHEDYSKPLEVMWVCMDCHRGLH